MKTISGFRGEHRFLSNFWPTRVSLDGLNFPTVEHAYQAAKTLDLNARRYICALAKPGEAKRAGRSVPMRPDWEQIKLAVMRDLVGQKFTGDLWLREQLLATGDAEIVEDNAWGDRFWGVCLGSGENHLGKIIMDVRASLHNVRQES